MHVSEDSYGSARSVVEQMVRQRAPFGTIEEFLEELHSVNEYQRSALWLLAWHGIPNAEASQLAEQLSRTIG